MMANSRARSSRVALTAANSTTSPASQREAEQELHRADHLVQHALHLVDGAAHVDVGDVGEGAHQRVVEAGPRARGTALM
jgi:hypothetical protein